MPSVSQDYKGDQIPASTGSEGNKSASTGSEGDELVMLETINLKALGMCRSPCLATQEGKQYACRTSLMKFCAFGMMMASSVADPGAVLSHGQACINSVVYQCKIVNSNFGKSLNSIHHMVLSAGQTANEVYTFKDMLKEDNHI